MTYVRFSFLLVQSVLENGAPGPLPSFFFFFCFHCCIFCISVFNVSIIIDPLWSQYRRVAASTTRSVETPLFPRVVAPSEERGVGPLSYSLRHFPFTRVRVVFRTPPSKQPSCTSRQPSCP